ncbi:MAG: cytochrome b/b6 domain-containing protein [Anaerolineales bacterium]|nr:cytochrome b/b6 domain-containing protein [Anaerolineales bacterium]
MSKKSTPKPAAPAVKKGTAKGKAIGRTKAPAKKQPAVYARFHWTQRIAHFLLLTSFSLLGLTGLPQKFPLAGWAQAMIRFFGGIEMTRSLHHVFAVVLMLLTIYHIIDIGSKIFVLRVPLTMLPVIKDVKDAWQAFLYNLGVARTRPQMGRYTFEEKLEYWALVWGTIIMGLTGFMMWNPIATARILPGEAIPAAKAAHGGEALLAVAAIFIWHMYSVHIRRFNKSMFTGRLSEEEMLHEHPLELADIKAGLAERPVDSRTLRRRQRIYWPIAGLLTVAMLFGVYGFVGAETTATIAPPETQIEIFVPQTPTPLPTPAPGPLTWEAAIGPLFQQQCGICHASRAPTGLSLTSYAEALQGGSNGAVILPGDSINSLLVLVQAEGSHPATLRSADLERVRDWIDAGAPER